MKKQLLAAMTLAASSVLFAQENLLTALQQTPEAASAEQAAAAAAAADTAASADTASAAAPAVVQPVVVPVAPVVPQVPVVYAEYQPGAECTAWVVTDKLKPGASILSLTKQQKEGTHNKYFIDKNDAFAAANVQGVAAKQIIISWEGCINVESAGNYTLKAQSTRAQSTVRGARPGSYNAGCLIELNGKKEIEYNNTSSQDAAQGSSSVILKAGWNKVKVWIHANDSNQQVSVSYQKQKSPTEMPISPETMFYEPVEE
jgi:hypothetical protein